MENILIIVRKVLPIIKKTFLNNKKKGSWNLFDLKIRVGYLYIASIRSLKASFTLFRLTFMVGVTSPSSS